MEEIIFHINMPIKGTSKEILYSYICEGVVPTIFLFGAWKVLCKFSKKKIEQISRKIIIAFEIILILGWIDLLIARLNVSFGFVDYVLNQFKQSELIENEYIDPASVEVVFPEKKRNLIMIYVESAETTTQNVENGGVYESNYIPEMTQLAKDNISFSQSDLIVGAEVAKGSGWTMAALVSETTGLPLKLFDNADESISNGMGEYEHFLPGATSLGDILETEGYYNFFLAGSDFNFGGRSAFFKQHGNYEIWDYYTAKETGKIAEDYYEWWGFEDQKLYSYAKELILEISEKDKPFNFSLLTADTHHQDGYVCELCKNEWAEQYANVWSCASRQLNEFILWIQQQDFYDNTTVVVVGDHYSMDADFYDIVVDDKIVKASRYVYNAFINSVVQPVNEKNRKFVTMDFFPSILASMGVVIEGDKLGLGTNLFSNEETLCEKYGYDYFYSELSKKSNFYDRKILYP